METINYIAQSKYESIRFKKHTYIINLENINGLIKGQKLTYGYLQTSINIGSPKGWFYSQISMTKEQFLERYDMIEGSVKVKINQ